MTDPAPSPAVRPGAPVGFVGLGLMGSEIVARLLRGGFRVVVHNRTAVKAAPLLAEGAEWAASPAAVARRAAGGLLVIMLTDGEAVREVLHGPEGIASGASAGTLVVDLSSIGPDESWRNARELEPLGVHYVDAPVVGSTDLARSGQLLVLVGGGSADVERARPMLERFARRIEHLGPVGSGSSMKMANNLVLAGNIALVGESLALAEGLGLDRRQVLALLSDGGASSRVLEVKREFLERSDYPPMFKLALARKDVVLAVTTAGAHGIGLEIGPEVRRWFDLAFGDGRGDQDFSSVVESELSRLSPSRRSPVAGDAGR